MKAGGGWDALREALLGDAATPPQARPYRTVFLLREPAQQGFQVCRGSACLPTVRTAPEAAAAL